MSEKDGRFEPGNQLRTKHGGAGALKRITADKPLVGLAREAELSVYDELEERGRYALVVRNAARLQAACDLYWDAVSKAAQDGDLDALDRYVKRYGWLASSSLRAWAQVRNETPDRADVLDYEEILARQGEDSGDD
jgi:hypothetical protein